MVTGNALSRVRNSRNSTLSIASGSSHVTLSQRLPSFLVIIIIVSCRLLEQKVDMPQCKLSKDVDLEPNF